MADENKGGPSADDFSFINARMKELAKDREDMQKKRNEAEAEENRKAKEGASSGVDVNAAALTTKEPGHYVGGYLIDYTQMAPPGFRHIPYDWP